MKLFTFFLFIATLQLNAKSYSQKINLSGSNITLKQAFRQIEKQTGYSFFINHRLLKAEDPVSFSLQDATIGEAIRALLKGKQLSYVIIDKTVVLKEKPDPVPTTEILLPGHMVEGVVKDSATGEPLAGVTIRVKGTTTGTVTDGSGRFSLEAEDDAVLEISFVGYASRQVSINGRNSMDILLASSATGLDQLVVVGYGSMKREDLTNSVSQINSEIFEDRPIVDATKALAGTIAGVRAQETSGRPGSPLTIKVRGIGSITGGTSPLYVIDGVPVEGGLNDINTDDIESIQVLKDAAAAAIYGSRGSNGVVLITTKRGQSGKFKIGLSIKGGIQQVFKFYDVLNRDEWIDFAIEERTNTYLYNGGDPNVPEDERPGYTRINPKWRTDPQSFPDNNWQKLVFRNALFQDYQIDVSGGDKRTQYYFSTGYLNQEGLMIKSNYKRYSFSTNVSSSINNRLSLGLSLRTSYSTSADPSNAGTEQSPISRSVLVAPIVGINQNTAETGFDPYVATFLLNPLLWAQQVTDSRSHFRGLASFFGQVEIINGLSFRSSLSGQILDSRQDYFMTNSINRGNGSNAINSSGQTINLLNENIFTYNRSFGEHHLNAIAGFTAQRVASQSSNANGTGFPSESVRTLNVATNILSASSSSSSNRLLSYLARGIYDYKDKYFLTASIRADGSSKFGKNNRWGWFPSISGGWRISREEFFKNLDFVNDLKLRGSYGLTGNYSLTGGNYPAIGTLGLANYVFGEGLGEKITGLAQSSISNPDLTWEKNHTWDVGIDFGFMKNRIGLSLDLYKSVVRDLLLNVPVSEITGFRNEIQNIGEIENSGFEAEVNAKILTGKLKWDLIGNFSYNKNKVKKLGPEGTPLPGSASGHQITLTEIGSPIGAYYLIPVLGVFQDQEEIDRSPVSKREEPGDLKYKDVNGDGKIDDNDRVIVGHANPDYFWGITNTFRFRKFDFSFFIDGEQGGSLINSLLSQDGQSRQNVLTYWLDRWRSPEHPGNGKVPRAAVTDNLTTASTFWMNDASFTRLRNVTLGYTFKENIKFISRLRAYFSVENIVSFDHYYGNPQVGEESNSPLVPGIDGFNTYPLARTYTLGLNVSFQ